MILIDIFINIGMINEGFTLSGHELCPIVPIMLGDAKLASNMAEEMLSIYIFIIFSCFDSLIFIVTF